MNLLSSEQVLARTRTTLGLDVAKDAQSVDEALLAQLLRAVAWSNCPCQPFLLVREVERGLKGLVSDTDSLRAHIAQVLESLIVTGDLLEPGQVTHVDEGRKGLLFPAPPSFAMLSEEVAQLFGVASEEEIEGPPELQGRIDYDGVSRRVTAKPGESLAAKLRVAGLRELSMQAWLGEPGAESAAEYLASGRKRLRRAEPADAMIDGLEVFDSSVGGIYSACWVMPAGRSGLFVARRPRAYGNHLWMVVELGGGCVEKSTNLPQTGSPFRGCDEAWRTQLALDSINGRPQRYRVRQEAVAAYLDMLFPVPLWAHRHLLVMGRQSPALKSICSYQVSKDLLSEARSFLEQKLWMKTTS